VLGGDDIGSRRQIFPPFEIRAEPSNSRSASHTVRIQKRAKPTKTLCGTRHFSSSQAVMLHMAVKEKKNAS